MTGLLQLGFHADGAIHFVDYQTGQESFAQDPFPRNVWKHLRIVVDYVDQSSDYFLDGTLIGDDIGTVSIIGGMGLVGWFAEELGDDTLYMDNLRIVYSDSPGTCLGDLNNDGNVGLQDLAVLLASFGGAGGSENGDFDNDGDVDLQDLAQMLSVFGSACP